MSDNEPLRPNRTIFQPSPLSQLRSAAGRTSLEEPAAAAPATPSPVFVPKDDIPRPSTPAERRNPLLARAAPLLALLASIRSGRARVSLPDLHRRASADIAAIQAEFVGKVAEDHLRRAVYALAATADDVAQNLPLPEAEIAEWTQRSLGAQFFQEAIGGDRFWRLLDEMVARPSEFQNLLELYHACMAAGFEGRYRVMADGRHAHQALMLRVYQALEVGRHISQTELTPHWRGVNAPTGKVGLWAPLALAAAVALGVLLTTNIVLRLILETTSAPARQALALINPPTKLTLGPRQTPPMPISSQYDLVSKFLAPEIAQNLVKVTDTPAGVRVITTGNVEDFASGSEQIAPGAQNLFSRIAQAINTVTGDIAVEGYTDSTQPRGLSFTDNLSLSNARAATVANLIQAALIDKSRHVTARGFGEADPVASNDNETGKAQNRRVEILIERSGA